ncbi:MAG: STAS domain-containing protein [Thermoanaerobaculia bacterium]|nr:STAS domain-containing protein [Thermoanaerobaculia bacterium]
MMKIHSRKDEGVTILALEGKLTIGDGDVTLREEIGDTLAAGVKKILLDLQAVKSMDSSGLGELIRCKTTAINQGAVIKLLHVEDKVQQVLEMTRLIGVFETFDDPIDAIASFRER